MIEHSCGKFSSMTGVGSYIYRASLGMSAAIVDCMQALVRLYRY